MKEDPTLKRIVEVIVEVLDPDAIILFGSRARGDHNKDSDYDILVLKEGVRPKERRRLAYEISKALLDEGLYAKADIDVLVQSPERFQALKDRWDLIYHDIHREGRVIYERERPF